MSRMGYKNTAGDYGELLRDAMQEVDDRRNENAFYMGVGWGKAESGDEYIGFSGREERESFDRGRENKGKHFSVHKRILKKPKKPGFLARLFGAKSDQEKSLDSHAMAEARKDSKREKRRQNKLDAMKKKKRDKADKNVSKKERSKSYSGVTRSKDRTPKRYHIIKNK